jgi:hypothetical protein
MAFVSMANLAFTVSPLPFSRSGFCDLVQPFPSKAISRSNQPFVTIEE